MSDTPPLDQRSRRRLARTGIPLSIVRRDRASQPATELLPAAVAAEQQLNIALARTTAPLDTTSDDSDDAPRTITTCVSVHTHGGELVKRPRPSTSSSGGSDEQEDKRVKLTRLALTTRPTIYADISRSPNPPSTEIHGAERETAHDSSPPLTQRRSPPLQPGSPPRREMPSPVAAPRTAPLLSPMHLSRSHDPSMSQSETLPQESASWPKDSTSYAGLASPTQLDVPMHPVSPQPGTSYAAAANAPTPPRCTPQPTAAAASTDPAPRSTYPPLVVERLPNWTVHFQALGGILGHAPNARPLGGGVRFLPKSAEEFRAVQRYLITAAAQDSAISWYCYSPATEIPVKVAIRGLLLDTPTEAVVAALRERGFPAEAARAIPPPRGKHGCTYFVRLAHLSQEELRDLYSTTELLYMPQVTVEAWRGGHKPPQCFRCQLFSHSSVNCHRPMRCVRCAGEHAVKDCSSPREDPTCANCGQGHAANDRRCTFYKKEARRRGIVQPPPPPRAKQRQRQQQRATNDPVHPAPPSTTPVRREARQDAAASTTALPDTAAPRAATPGAAEPAAGASRAATFAPLLTGLNHTPATATRPATLVADANPPTTRGTAIPGRKRRRTRALRPAQTEPAAASTPQQRQPRTGERESSPSGPSAASRPAPTLNTMQRTAPASQAHPNAPPAHQSAQGEAQTNPDIVAVVRVVVEALITGLTAYLQGQGALPALAAGMAVLTRLHSC